MQLDHAPIPSDAATVITPAALSFVADLHLAFEARRAALLEARVTRQRALDAGARHAFPAGDDGTAHLDFRVPPAPAALRDRRVEITGPAERKMMINALNSGAKVFLCDVEDALSPTWANVTAAQRNLYDHAHGTLEHHDAARGKRYVVGSDPATLVMRPRGWHLHEAHLRVDGSAVSASLFDFGVWAFHCAAALYDRGDGPFVYLPKLEGRHEARLWSDVFTWTERRLDLPHGTVRATVLIETLPAAFEMDEILYELRDHATGLNAGRWDYIFSLIKQLRAHPASSLPDRAQVTMRVPFMSAYTDLLVRTCHRRGAHAIGGMSAFIPNRSDPEVTERAFAAVTADKQLEADKGFDGTWVAHPDLVPVAQAVFDDVLGSRPNQLEHPGRERTVNADDLLDTRIDGGTVTDAGIRANVDVALRYLEAWLSGTGAAAIHNLMEDVATAEISRAQLWIWRRRAARVDDGSTFDAERYLHVRNELATDDTVGVAAARLLDALVLDDDFASFLTLSAYPELVADTAREVRSARD